MSKIINLLFFLLVGMGVVCAQRTYRVRGIVVDHDNGTPVSSASVQIKETKIGTITDLNGKFSIEVPREGDAHVEISYMGYKTLVVSIVASLSNDAHRFVLERSSESLDEIVVTGTGTAHSLKRVPVRTELISGKQIEQMGAANIEEILAMVNPSMSFSPNAMGSFMKINGLGNDYILILVDGKRMYGDMGGNSDLNRIPLSNIKQIEIVKGASSSLYGSEAIAGVINIITKTPKNGISASNDTYLGAYGQFRQNNQVSYKAKGWSTSSTVSYKTSDGWQLSSVEKPSRKMIRKGQKDPVPTLAKASNEYQDRSFIQSLRFTPNDKFSLGATGTIFDKEVIYPVAYKSYNSYFTDANLSIDGAYTFSEKAKISFEGYYDNYKYKYLYNQKYNIAYNENGIQHQKTFYSGDEQLNTNQILRTAKLNGVFVLPLNNTLSVGAEHMYEFLEAPFRFKGNDVNATTTSAYAQDEWSTKYVTLVAGVRYVNHEAFGSMFTPKVSAMVGNSWIKLRSSLGQGFKAPTLKELYYYYEKEGMGSHYLYLGNKDLKPQESTYYDISLELDFNKLNFSVSAYHNKVNNMIAYKVIPTPVSAEEMGVKITKQQVNIDEALTEGVDVAMDWRICSFLQFNAGYSYVDAKDVETDKVLDGVSEHKANTQLSWLHQTKHIGFRYIIQGKGQSKRFYGKEEVDGFMLWNFIANHSFTINNFKFNAKVGVDNLFDYMDDKPYGYHYSTLSPGRTFFAGLQIYFN
ncbi:TonB-dependent receptor [Halosquirtibacter xylanolyticus]|uniref:TonB-dependent receptor n=1 Tax=Halosquirtibacter xylanolyticus TaxID=3374599 RepID=UPI003747CADC|nr:TonB-dependent receptor [Prolixibacteraceae bacterium]